MKPVIIIGTGLAGYTLARELRKLDKTVPLVIMTADSGGFYSKPMLSNAFAQGKNADQLITQSAEKMAAQLNATILAHTRVTGIDTDAHIVSTSAGDFEYAKLVIATGAQPIRIPMGGNAGNEVLSVNHLSDYTTFRERLAAHSSQAGARVAILGAGLIGCEFADDLTGGGHWVTLVDPNSLPLAALAAPMLSQHLKNALTECGVTLKLGTTAASVDHENGGLKITLANGEVLEADIVLSAIGLRPDISLAQAAQLQTGRGIVVDTTGRTSAADVYALGDCAEYTLHGTGGTRVMPYVAPLMNAARAIARTLAGEPTPIDLKPSPVVVKTTSFPLALLPPPIDKNAHGEWRHETVGKHVVCRFYDRDGAMAGFGVSHHEPGIRSSLMAELGAKAAA